MSRVTSYASLAGAFNFGYRHIMLRQHDLQIHGKSHVSFIAVSNEQVIVHATLTWKNRHSLTPTNCDTCFYFQTFSGSPFSNSNTQSPAWPVTCMQVCAERKNSAHPRGGFPCTCGSSRHTVRAVSVMHTAFSPSSLLNATIGIRPARSGHVQYGP